MKKHRSQLPRPVEWVDGEDAWQFINRRGGITRDEIKSVLQICNEKEAVLQVQAFSSEEELDRIVAELEKIKRVRIIIGICAIAM
jgi:hypothetical protein